MHQLTKKQVNNLFDYEEFIPFLESFLCKEITSPNRMHYSIPVSQSKNATLLSMPAWSVDEYIGVKIVNVFPDNQELPTINGSYLLMSGRTGELLCIIDGLALTQKRTAAVSALASHLLSPKEVTTFCMIGTGNLSHELIKAHHSVRSFSKVMIWGRNFDKAKSKADSLELKGTEIRPIADKAVGISQADIISCATLSATPLIDGTMLKENVYLDLVGSFKPESREADDHCVQNANIYVDTFKALEESGDLYIPLKKGLISQQDIKSDLVTLCKMASTNQKPDDQKTFFKSVGFAAPDLAAATYLYEKLNR
ncbi:MAG: ornithine cyclodeaminase [Saprospiraceae bacterium]|nr:MAG: ornithine cyclodeaminase [Saprospiraceae bacterium]